MKDVSFETLDLLAELEEGQRNAKPIALLARKLDVTKKKVIKMINNARNELCDTDVLIMNNGKGGFYIKEVEDGNSKDPEVQSMLQLFRA